MTEKVTVLGCVTMLDLPPDRVLQAAVGKLSGVVVAGWDKDGNLYLASSNNPPETLWLLERARSDLLRTP